MPTEEPVKEETTRDAIEAAFAAAELQTDAVDTTPEVKETPEPVSAADDAATVDDAKPADDTPPVTAKESTPALGGDGKASEDDTIPERAPTSWKPAAREKFAALDPDVKKEIARIDREVQKTLSHSVQARKFSQAFQEMAAPFEPLIRARNSNPITAARNMFETAAGLTLGTQEQKANIIAEIIKNYSIDLKTLDSILAGQPLPAASGTSPNIEAMIQKQLEPVHRFIGSVEQTRAQRDAQIEQEADSAMAAFAEKHEFFDDLREEMADIMEIDARRGRKTTMEAAYTRALKNNPEIEKIVLQRSAAKSNGTALERARRASSSVRGSPIVNAAPAVENQSRASDIEAAWEQQQGR